MKNKRAIKLTAALTEFGNMFPLEGAVPLFVAANLLLENSSVQFMVLVSFRFLTLSPFSPRKPGGPGIPGRPGSPLGP